MQEVPGKFDQAGVLSPLDPAYWRALDAHLERTTTLKHVSPRGGAAGRSQPGRRGSTGTAACSTRAGASGRGSHAPSWEGADGDCCAAMRSAVPNGVPPFLPHLGPPPSSCPPKMFESTWYRCSKLSNGMPERYPSTQLMEEAALKHVLQWLGLR